MKDIHRCAGAGPRCEGLDQLLDSGGGGERLLAAATGQMVKGLYMVPHPAVRLRRLGYDTALIGTIAITRHGLA